MCIILFFNWSSTVLPVHCRWPSDDGGGNVVIIIMRALPIYIYSCLGKSPRGYRSYRGIDVHLFPREAFEPWGFYPTVKFILKHHCTFTFTSAHLLVYTCIKPERDLYIIPPYGTFGALRGERVREKIGGGGESARRYQFIYLFGRCRGRSAAGLRLMIRFSNCSEFFSLCLTFSHYLSLSLTHTFIFVYTSYIPTLCGSADRRAS